MKIVKRNEMNILTAIVKYAIWMTILIVLSFAEIHAQQSRNECVKPTGFKFHSVGRDLGSMLLNLSNQCRISIAFERICDGKCVLSKPIEVHIKNATLQIILEEFEKKFPEYSFKSSGESVVVSPRKLGQFLFLDTEISEFQVENTDVTEIPGLLFGHAEVMERLRELKLTDAGSIEYDGPVRQLMPFSMNLKSTTLREILNEIVRQRYATMWTATRFGKDLQYVEIQLEESVVE